MADRRGTSTKMKTAHVPNSLLASARILSDMRLPTRQPEVWHDDAWQMYDDVGELRYGVTYISNALSRVRIIAAEPGTPANPEPTPLLEGPAVDAVTRLAGGAVGQSGMLAAFGVVLTVGGIGYLVGETTTDGTERWNVYAPDALKLESEVYKVQEDEGKWRDLAPDSVVVQVWRPSRRKPWEPDSSVRGVMKTLEELNLLNQRIIADATSRLAGAGILVIPSEAEFPKVRPDDPNEDPFTETFLVYMTTPIKNRDSAAAVVPFLIRIPAQYADAVRHVSLSTAFDDNLLEMRDAAVRRLAVGLDLPVEAVLGLGDVNHWSAWQISDEAVELHVDPVMEMICEALTVGYLAPALAAAGAAPDSAVIWYDDSALRTPADQSGQAVAMYDRGELKGDAMRRESSFTESDKPTDEELRRQVLIHTALTRPDLLTSVRAELDAFLAPGGPQAPAPGGLPDATPAQAPGSDTTPSTRPRTSPGPGPAPAPRPAEGPPAPGGPTAPVAAGASLAQLDALLAACDGLVLRTLERAGAKLRRRAGSGVAEGCAADAAELHCCIPQSVVAAANMDDLLAGAWDRLGPICDRYHTDEVALRRFLDGYTRSLIASGTAHSYDVLADAFGYTTSVTTS